MLKVENLDVFHGDAQALDGVSLEIEEGAIVAIVGANGAGKTSLIRTIAGMHRPTRGRVFFRGLDIAGWPSHKVCDLGIGQVAEGRQVFPSLSVAENLAMGAMLPRARDLARTKSRESLCAVSGSYRTPAPSGRYVVRRRAADACHWALPDGRARTGDVRRAISRVSANRRAKRAATRARPQQRWTDLRARGAERRGVSKTRELRLRAGERPHHSRRLRRDVAR